MEQEKKNKHLLPILLIILFVVAAILLFLIFQHIASSGLAENTSVSQENISLENPDIIYQNEDIEIYTFFPSSVVNTDADATYVEDVASIEFKNISESYLKTCEIQIKTADGTWFTFVAEDIPVGMEVMSFEQSNQTIEEGIEIADVKCSTEVEISDVLLENQIEFFENELEIVVKNVGKEDLEDLVISCHCMMDDVSYGGSKYEYSLKYLKTGESATIYADDCYFGQAKVVRIAVNE